MLDPVVTYVQPHQKEHLQKKAAARNLDVSALVRLEIHHLLQPKGQPLFTRLRLHFLRKWRDERLSEAAYLREEAEHIAALAATLDGRPGYEARRAHASLRDRLLQVEARIGELDDDIAKAGGATIPALVVLAAGASGWVWGLTALLIPAAAGVYFLVRHARRAPRAVESAHADGDAVEDAAYASAAEYERKFLWDPRFLWKRIEEFLNQPQSAELMRMATEDRAFAAVDSTGKHVTLYLRVFDEEQLARIPPDLAGDILSARTRRVATPATTRSQDDPPARPARSLTPDEATPRGRGRPPKAKAAVPTPLAAASQMNGHGAEGDHVEILLGEEDE